MMMAALNVYGARRTEREFPPRGRFLAMGGVRLHFLDEGSDRPVILLHGNGATGEDFRLSGLLDLLAARRYRAIAFDPHCACRL
jgi:pimeloyl-ACP methyl ester carboxylesterase